MPLPPRQAVELIQQRLDELDQLTGTGGDFKDWRERTEATLRNALPATHTALSKFSVMRWSPVMYTFGDNSRSMAASFNSGKSSASALLKAVIFELELEPDADRSSTSVLLDVAEVRKIEALIAAFHRADEEGELDPLDKESRAEAAAEVDVLEAQLRSPRPKRAIVKPALRSLAGILQVGLGSAAGAGIVLIVQEAAKVIH